MCFLHAGLCLVAYIVKALYVFWLYKFHFLTHSLLWYVAISLVIFQFAMYFVFTDCPVLCFVAVLSNHCVSRLVGWFVFGWCPCCTLLVVFFFTDMNEQCLSCCENRLRMSVIP